MALKKVPLDWRDSNASAVAALREVMMVSAECPVDQAEFLKRGDELVPNPRYTGQMNCQQNGDRHTGKWDIDECESRGHHPYESEFETRVTEDQLDEEGYVIGTRTKVIKQRRPNFRPVTISERHSTGAEYRMRLQMRWKTLDMIGFEGWCEYRGCNKDIKVRTNWGNYCSKDHAQSVAATELSIFLPIAASADAAQAVAAERRMLLAGVELEYSERSPEKA